MTAPGVKRLVRGKAGRIASLLREYGVQVVEEEEAVA